jgi:hypothetical protein
MKPIVMNCLIVYQLLNVERRQAFDLLEQNRLKCTMVPEFLARLAHSLSKRAIDFHDESILRIFTYSNKRKF